MAESQQTCLCFAELMQPVKHCGDDMLDFSCTSSVHFKSLVDSPCFCFDLNPASDVILYCRFSLNPAV